MTFSCVRPNPQGANVKGFRQTARDPEPAYRSGPRDRYVLSAVRAREAHDGDRVAAHVDRHLDRRRALVAVQHAGVEPAGPVAAVGVGPGAGTHAGVVAHAVRVGAAVAVVVAAVVAVGVCAAVAVGVAVAVAGTGPVAARVGVRATVAARVGEAHDGDRVAADVHRHLDRGRALVAVEHTGVVTGGPVGLSGSAGDQQAADSQTEDLCGPDDPAIHDGKTF